LFTSVNIAVATLTTALSLMVGHPVQIVTNNDHPGSWDGSAYPGYPVVNIGRDALGDAQNGGGRGLKILLHEVGHTTGITGEAEANCYALAHLPSFWMGIWGAELDPWASHALLSKVYGTAVAYMLQQSAAYQCQNYERSF